MRLVFKETVSRLTSTAKALLVASPEGLQAWLPRNMVAPDQTTAADVFMAACERTAQYAKDKERSFREAYCERIQLVNPHPHSPKIGDLDFGPRWRYAFTRDQAKERVLWMAEQVAEGAPVVDLLSQK